jgi:hypothetical protein
MMLPYDPLREAILLELNRAICARRAQGISLDAFELEYGSVEGSRAIDRQAQGSEPGEAGARSQTTAPPQSRRSDCFCEAPLRLTEVAVN